MANADVASPTVHERVVSTYNFAPHSLDDAGLTAHSKELDAFWTFVKMGGTQRLEELRAELRRTDAPLFFSYDGAKLLLSLSKNKADEKLALTAITRADLRDVQQDDFLFTIHAFAVDELDTSEAAFKILADPTFKVFVPQHALTLEHDYCLLYLLLPTKEEYYLDKAIARLSKEKDPTAFKSLLHLIAATVTKKGDDAIKRYVDDESRPAELRGFAKTIQDVMKAMAAAPMPEISFSSYASLKQEQRKIMGQISDEALYEFDRVEVQLRHRGPQ
jgi:hypothetical protein